MTLGPRIRRALVSVSDKTGLDVLAKALVEANVEVLSTGGTFDRLTALGVDAIKVSTFTGAPEILGGRVKTLHPRIHGGILARDTPDDEAELERLGMAPIDLVVVNLYPFREAVARPECTWTEAMENVDIGGPTMIRAAAKNWARVAVVVDPSDYVLVAEVLRSGTSTPESRFQWARKAFAHTASYDAAIANHFGRHDPNGQRLEPAEVGSPLFFGGDAPEPLRYGENPHQPARFVPTRLAAGEPSGFDSAKQRQGKPLSYNNLLDADGALGLVRDLAPLGAAAVVFKHVSPCGAAIARNDESLAETYLRAREADAESAFGGIVALSRPIDRAVAEALVETFLEVVIAPGVDDDAIDVLGRKPNLRVLELADLAKVQGGPPPLRLRSIAGGILVQREDHIAVEVGAARVVTRRAPTPEQIRALELAQRVGKHVRSNAIVLVRNETTVGIGGGQTSRVEASRQAVARAGDRAAGSVLASDAFFPFRDGVDAAAAAGVVAIVQPGGSRRDEEVIAAADEHGIAMVFTGERHFRH